MPGSPSVPLDFLRPAIVVTLLTRKARSDRPEFGIIHGRSSTREECCIEIIRLRVTDGVKVSRKRLKSFSRLYQTCVEIYLPLKTNLKNFFFYIL